jgi:hypothetical protein
MTATRHGAAGSLCDAGVGVWRGALRGGKMGTAQGGHQRREGARHIMVRHRGTRRGIGGREVGRANGEEWA